MFQPEVDQPLAIGDHTWIFTEHPSLPGSGIPYGQEGRAGIVYQLGDDAGDLRALKVFKPHFRQPYLVGLSDKLRTFAALPGLTVCDRSVLIPQEHGNLLRQHPGLIYAAVMPWVEGQTWSEIVGRGKVLSEEQSLALANAMSGVLLQLEQQGVAHGDVSGSNVIFDALDSDQATLELVDVEQLYAPSLDRPDTVPGGSPGYARKSASTHLWQADMDRFAGAVMLAEMLGWCDQRIVDAAAGETYFAEKELQQNSQRFELLRTVLAERWGEAPASLLEQAWASQMLRQCPTFGEWHIALPTLATQATDENDLDYWLVTAQAAMASRDWPEAFRAYESALPLAETRSSLAKELSLIIAGLESKIGGQQTQVKVSEVDEPDDTPPEPEQKRSLLLWGLVPLLLLLAAGVSWVIVGGNGGVVDPDATSASPISVAEIAVANATEPSTATLVAAVSSDTATPTASATATLLPTSTSIPSSISPPNPASNVITVNAVEDVFTREGSGRSHPIAGSLMEGDSVRVLGKSPNGTWLLIEQPDSNFSWVAAKSTTGLSSELLSRLGVAIALPTSTSIPSSISPPNPASDVITVSAVEDVFTREGSGRSHPIAGSLMEGDLVRVLGKSPNGSWLLIEQPDNNHSWVEAKSTLGLSSELLSRLAVITAPLVSATATETPTATPKLPTKVLYLDYCDPRTDSDFCQISSSLEVLEDFYNVIDDLGFILEYAIPETDELDDYAITIADFCGPAVSHSAALETYVASGGSLITMANNACLIDDIYAAEYADRFTSAYGIRYSDEDLGNGAHKFAVPTSNHPIGIGVDNLYLGRHTILEVDSPASIVFSLSDRPVVAVYDDQTEGTIVALTANLEWGPRPISHSQMAEDLNDPELLARFQAADELIEESDNFVFWRNLLRWLDGRSTAKRIPFDPIAPVNP